jgi:BNR repeat-containing family member
MRYRNVLGFLLWAVLSIGFSSDVRAASVKFQAESGTLGANFSIGNDGATQFITISPTGAGNAPSNSTRVAAYSVTFPEDGTYDLYARVRVGAGGLNDDSFFYGNGFGNKSPTTVADWILVNNINNTGYTNSSSIVGGAGTVGTGVWKWINLSEYMGSGTPISFTVTAGNLTQTFQIGGREDGLDIDQLLFGSLSNTFTVAELDAGGPGTPPPPPPPVQAGDFVTGNLIQFNDNGNWTWYCDERSVIDKARGRIIVGSDGNGAGVGGSARNGAIEVAMFDLQTGIPTRTTLLPSGTLGADDHNTPGLMVWPDGKYLAQWTGHNQNFLTYFSIFDGTNWNPYTTFDWQTLGATSSEMASYSNPHYLPAEGRTYTFVRSLDIKSMNLLLSTNEGSTWTYYGKLNRSYPGSGYNPGYYRFCDNGQDRIDFICTERHPRDTLVTNNYLRFTSIYHGYISNGMSFKSDGTVVDTNLNDTIAPLSSDFTLVFSNETVMPMGQTNYRCWNSDVQYYPDGTVEAIIHARINQFDHPGGYPDTEDPNHAFFFCRWDGTKWTSTYLCQAGYKLYPAEADYVGLGALNPNDPNTIFISTRYDPRAVQPGVTDTNQPYSAWHEIWKGVTTNHGASFTWTPITQNSSHDNLRPIVPPWDTNNTALIWFRATYSTAQIIDGAPVGLVERRAEATAAMTYVDATTNNTALATGGALVPSDSANQWHTRTNAGNAGSLFASADVSAENAPLLKTSATLPGTGTYDVWVNFWGKPNADWRIVAGLSTNNLRVFREMACEEVEPGEHNSTLVLSNSSAFLYQAYVGRVIGASVDVFIDDNDIVTGTTATTAGDTVRTWYDGISYAAVTPVQIRLAIDYDAASGSATLRWNSVSPLLASPSAVTYTVQKKNALTDPNWITLVSGLPSAGTATSYVDNSATGDVAFYRIVSP